MSEKKHTVRSSIEQKRDALAEWMAENKIEQKLHVYLARCHQEDEGRSGEFPNLAGFCRYLGVGVRTFCELGEEYPMAYDAVMTQLEDEALNASKLPANSASLTTAYFKRRLGYDGDSGEGHEAVDGVAQVVFDHDILASGV